MLLRTDKKVFKLKLIPFYIPVLICVYMKISLSSNICEYFTEVKRWVQVEEVFYTLYSNACRIQVQELKDKSP